MSALERNAQVWESLYAAGRNDLQYPAEALVRLSTGLLGGPPRRVLDYGCGTGANTAHLARLGHRVHGIEVSPSALAKASQRLRAGGLEADLRCVAPGTPLPFSDASFDAVVAWQVLYYNDRSGWAAAVREIERVLVPGGLVIVATAAPGDVSHAQGEPLGEGTYRSTVGGQAGCILTIPEEKGLAALFPGRALEIGEFAFSHAATRSRHWLVTYRVPAS